MRERIRNAWMNRCLWCLFRPFHGAVPEPAPEPPTEADLDAKAADDEIERQRLY